jgi:hypothetical protein
MTDDELRQLDREIAELLGWVYEPSDNPEVDMRWRDPNPNALLPYAERQPAYSSTWEGFGLLVEEFKRRGWAQEMCSHTSGWIVDLCDSYGASEATLPLANAFAARDALQAAKEREG